MLDKGPLIQYRVAGIKFRLKDGAHHIVDSTEIAFINTAKGAMKHGQLFNVGLVGSRRKMTCPVILRLVQCSRTATGF